MRATTILLCAALGGAAVPALPSAFSFSSQERARVESVPAAELQKAIGQLSALDFKVRSASARTIRRAPAAEATAALLKAIKEQKDGYVRYQALVLLTGFNDPRARDQALAAIADANDRMRQIGYEYLEYNADPKVVPALLKALGQESGEFVRPALLRALAAHGADARVREALVPQIGRGETMFRSALIEALGDYRAAYAVPPLVDTVQMEGPLQLDAAIALGKIGDRRALAALVAAQRGAPQEAQPQVAAALCLMGVSCADNVGYLDKTLRFAAKNTGYQPLLRSAASAAGALGQAGNADALNLLLDVGIPSDDPARAPLALALGAVALRNTPFFLKTLEERPDPEQAILLLRDGFDMLEEPYLEERFFATVRRAYWQAPEGSDQRKVAQQLIETLEF